MSANSTISAKVFAAYLRCPTKAHLLARGERLPGTFFTDMLDRISTAYRTAARERLGASVADFQSVGRLTSAAKPTSDRAVVFVDCETTSYALDTATRTRSDCKTRRGEPSSDYMPVLFSAWDQSDQLHNLLVCFGALAIQQVTGREIPSVGKIIYGEGHCIRTIKIKHYLSKTQQVIEGIISAGVAVEPALVLKKHCRTSDFQTRCRGLAMEQENLSLLGAMTAKERMRCREKGISTITQLSYGYRPRRKRRVKQNDPPRTLSVRHDHKLKALAIKKAQIHVMSGRIEARTGLRMMPTFPRSPRSFRTAGFPQYGWKAGLSGGAFPDRQRLKPALGMHLLTPGLPSPFVHLRVGAVVPYCAGPPTGRCTAMEGGSPSAPGALARVRVMLSRSVVAYRPHPPHSPAHRDFTARR